MYKYGANLCVWSLLQLHCNSVYVWVCVCFVYVCLTYVWLLCHCRAWMWWAPQLHYTFTASCTWFVCESDNLVPEQKFIDEHIFYRRLLMNIFHMLCTYINLQVNVVHIFKDSGVVGCFSTILLYRVFILNYVDVRVSCEGNIVHVEYGM